MRQICLILLPWKVDSRVTRPVGNIQIWSRLANHEHAIRRHLIISIFVSKMETTSSYFKLLLPYVNVTSLFVQYSFFFGNPRY